MVVLSLHVGCLESPHAREPVTRRTEDRLEDRGLRRMLQTRSCLDDRLTPAGAPALATSADRDGTCSRREERGKADRTSYLKEAGVRDLIACHAVLIETMCAQLRRQYGGSRSLDRSCFLHCALRARGNRDNCTCTLIWAIRDR